MREGKREKDIEYRRTKNKKRKRERTIIMKKKKETKNKTKLYFFTIFFSLHCKITSKIYE
jgi:hypothetical protein